jgi:low temperature requirement protein LtrA
MISDRNLLRTRTEHEHNRVTFVELFFDVVFVFAVTQLSHSLMEHFTPVGAVETLLLLLAVWWVWIDTVWATNWLHPEKLPVRLLLLGLMLAGLLLSSSIPQAFDSRGLAFASAYMVMQIGRTAFVLWAFKHNPVQRRNFQRILSWRALSSLLWIVGGLAHDTARLGIWTLALVVESVAPAVGFWAPGLGHSITRDWTVEGGHFAERCGLFIIIALGESILVTGATFSGLEWASATVAAFVAAFVASVALWWLYFDVVAEFGSETMSASNDPGRFARSAYTYMHLFIVAGIIVSAVADEFVLAHPMGSNEIEVTLSVLGGPALYLIGNLLFKWAIARKLRISHVIGLFLLVLLIPVAVVATPLALLTAATLVLVGIAAWEASSSRRGRAPHLVRTGVHW